MEYVCLPNDILNTCSPINAFSQKNSTPNTVILQYSLSITNLLLYIFYYLFLFKSFLL